MLQQLSLRFGNWGKSAYARITLNGFTKAFFLFSIVCCLLQGLIQYFLFSLDFEHSEFVSGLVKAGRIPDGNTTYLEGTRGQLHLRMCDDIPHGQERYPCMTIFNSTTNNPKYNPARTVTPLQSMDLNNWERGLKVSQIQDPTNSTHVLAVRLDLWNGAAASLSEQCIKVLVFPSQILINLRREDIAWICLQFWLLAISFLGIINGSIPHILAVLITRTLVASWSMYATWRGPHFRANFQELIGDPGTPCSLEMFNRFWNKRQGFEIADLVLSVIALLLFAYLSWSLLKIYSTQTFNRVGPPESVIRINKFFMALLACLQIEVFALVTAISLWIDVLMNTAIARMAEHTPVYKAVFIGTCILVLPWITMGWYSIRREMRFLMIIFLGLGFIIITCWSIMFYSIVYRWSFMQWPYLGCFTVASFILLISSMALGVVCRLNFGKGLAEYLFAEETLAKLNFSPDSFDSEKGPVNAKGSRFSVDSEAELKFRGVDSLSDKAYYVPKKYRTSNPESSLRESRVGVPETPVHMRSGSGSTTEALAPIPTFEAYRWTEKERSPADTARPQSSVPPVRLQPARKEVPRF